MTATCGVQTSCAPLLQDDQEPVWQWEPETVRLKPSNSLSSQQVKTLGEWLRRSAALLSATRYAILGAESRAIRDFVQAVSSVAEVTEIVLFEDTEGTHIWTAMSEREWDAETAILRAHQQLREQYGRRKLDLFIAACPAGRLEEQVPSSFVRLYAKA